MKISNSKKELARIISENGGWRDGAEWAAQDSCGTLNSYQRKPVYSSGCTGFGHGGGYFHKICAAAKIKNWHQTILSREEYFHLYPATDAKPRFCESVMRSIPEPDEQVLKDPPSIEQLAADYRNAKDYAERKQQEADAAKADVDAKLKALEMAGEAVGLIVSPITDKQEPRLVITDWRDLRVGDLVVIVGSGNKAWSAFEGKELSVARTGRSEYELMFMSEDGDEWYASGNTQWNFIRRP